MRGIVKILALILSASIIVLAKKRRVHRYIEIAGMIILIACLVSFVSDFMRGFADGFIGSFKDGK